MSFDKAQADRLAVKIRKNILRAIASEGKGHIEALFRLQTLLQSFTVEWLM